MRRVMALATLFAVGCGTSEPSGPPFVLTTAAGVYDVTLTIAAQGSFGPSCATVTVTLGPSRSWTAACLNGVVPAGTTGMAADSLVLNVQSAGATRPIKLYDFTGTESEAQSEWSGAYCWDNPAIGGCVREHGVATWRKR